MARPPASWIARSVSSQRAEGRQPLGHEQRQDVAAARRDLLADHQVVREVARRVQLGGAQGAVDPLVVGDGDDVEVGVRFDVVEDLAHRGRAVGVERVDVHVGLAAFPAAARPSPTRDVRR